MPNLDFRVGQRMLNNYKSVCLIRHGETEFNARGVVQGCGIDAPLNSKGHTQANQFWDSYKDSEFDMVVYSFMLRSKQTIRKFITQPVQSRQYNDICEINWGINEGQPFSEEVLSRYNETIANWQQGQYDARIEGGESAAELGIRCKRFINWLESSNKKNILVCSHGRTIRALVCLFQNKPLSMMEEIRHDNLGVFKLIFDNATWHLDKENDTVHLLKNHNRIG